MLSCECIAAQARLPFFAKNPSLRFRELPSSFTLSRTLCFSSTLTYTAADAETPRKLSTQDIYSSALRPCSRPRLLCNQCPGTHCARFLRTGLCASALRIILIHMAASAQCRFVLCPALRKFALCKLSPGWPPGNDGKIGRGSRPPCELMSGRRAS